MDLFGLGILLEFKDMATSRMANASRVFQKMKTDAEGVDEAVKGVNNAFNASAMSYSSFIYAGRQVMGVGAKMASVFKGVADQVISTGSKFEKTRTTLTALYKDATLANDKLTWSMKLAAETPFEIGDVTDALVNFKAIGVDADQTFKNANGQMRSFLEYVGDLGALRPDQGLQGALWAVRELTEGQARSMKSRFGIDAQTQLGEAWAFGDQQKLMEQIVRISDKMANGLMEKLVGTWDQIISNLKDQKTRLLLAVSDNGAFDSAKKSLKSLSDVIAGISDEEMTKIGTNLAVVFSNLWKPIDAVFRGLVKVVNVTKDLILNNPKLVEAIAKVFGLVSMTTIVLGGLAVLGGMLGMLRLGIKTLGGTITSFATSLGMAGGGARGFAYTLGFLSMKLVSLLAIVGLLAIAWKSDFLGIKTVTESTFKGVKHAISSSIAILKMSTSDLIEACKKLEESDSIFDKMALGIVKTITFFKLLSEAWNGYTLSDESFRLANELGIMPLIESVLRAKMIFTAFFEGVEKGVKAFSDVLTSSFTKVSDSVGKFFSLFGKDNPLKETSDTLNSMQKFDTSSWEKIGEVVGVILGIVVVVGTILKVVSLIVSVGSIIWGVITTIVGFVTSIGTAIASVWGFVSGIVSAIGSVLVALAGILNLPVILVGAIIVAVVGLIAVIVVYFEEFCDILKSVGGLLLNTLTGITVFIVSAFANTFGALSQMFVGVFEGIKQMFAGIIQFIVGVFTGNWKTAWEGVANIFAGIFNSLISIVKGVVNVIIGLINSIISGLNAIRIDVPDWVPVFGGQNWGFSIPEIPKLNTGGYIKDEGISMLHPNEVVINDPLTQKLRAFLDSNNNNAPINNTTTGSTEVDNSIVIEEGAIQIHVASASKEEAERLAETIMLKIKRKQEMDKVKKYKPVLD